MTADLTDSRLTVTDQRERGACKLYFLEVTTRAGSPLPSRQRLLRTKPYHLSKRLNVTVVVAKTAK